MSNRVIQSATLKKNTQKKKIIPERSFRAAVGLLLALVISLSVTACSGGKGDKKTSAQGDTGAGDTESSVAGSDSQSSEDRINLDLSTMSGTMVYSQLYNILSKPDDYLGARIKVKGSFNVYTDNATGKTYYACLIYDATGCCQNGLEFVLADGKKYPEDYPEPNSEITVVGTFSTYKEGETLYCQLENAELAG